MLVKDQLNREIQIPSAPQRIVSLVPSQTELLVDLGLIESLVGVTKFCVHPKGFKEKVAAVGGTKSVHFDRIEALEPDLIICNKEENSLEMVLRLEEIAPVWVSDIISVYDSLEMVWQLGALLERQEEASAIIEGITSELEEFEAFMADQPKRNVAYLIWKNPYMAAGIETFIHSLLKLNNFRNIISEKRYPEISPADLARADLVLLSTEPFPFKETDVSELRTQLNTEVRLVDGEYFSWYGSRLRNAFDYFRTLHK